MTKEVTHRHMATRTTLLIVLRYAETPDLAANGSKKTLQVCYIHPSQKKPKPLTLQYTST